MNINSFTLSVQAMDLLQDLFKDSEKAKQILNHLQTKDNKQVC